MISELYQWLTTHGYDWATSQLTNNDFLIGFLSTGILAGLTYLVRHLPMRIYMSIKNWISVNITINSSMRYYTEISGFLVDEVIWAKIQRKFLWDRVGGKSILGPGYGHHFGFFGGSIVTVFRDLMKDSVSEEFKEQTIITIYSRRAKVLSHFMKMVEEHIKRLQESDTLSIYSVSGSQGNWWRVMEKPFRPWDSLFLPAVTKRKVISHLDDFISSEATYEKYGTPYHTGIFVHGIPGCGKTSLIQVVASHLKRNIYYLNLNEIATDTKLVNVISGIECNDAVLVIEDIDASNLSLKRVKGKTGGPTLGLSLGAVLNFLDGVLTPHGLIVMATSNDMSRLDPALLRKGRFDLTIELGRLEWDEFYHMGQTFGVLESDLKAMKAGYKPTVPVDARTLFLTYLEGVALVKDKPKKIKLKDLETHRFDPVAWLEAAKELERDL